MVDPMKGVQTANNYLHSYSLPVRFISIFFVGVLSFNCIPVIAEEITCQAKKSALITASEIKNADSEVTAAIIINPDKGFKDDDLATEFVGECKILSSGIECENTVTMSDSEATLQNSIFTHLTVVDDSLDLIMVLKGYVPEAFSIVSIGSCAIK